MQVHWTGELSTQLPITDIDVAAWICSERPEMVRRLDTSGAAHPDPALTLEFMQRQPHFANAARLLYARAMHLVPPHAVPRLRVSA